MGTATATCGILLLCTMFLHNHVILLVDTVTNTSNLSEQNQHPHQRYTAISKTDDATLFLRHPTVKSSQSAVGEGTESDPEKVRLIDVDIGGNDDTNTDRTQIIQERDSDGSHRKYADSKKIDGADGTSLDETDTSDGTEDSESSSYEDEDDDEVEGRPHEEHIHHYMALEYEANFPWHDVDFSVRSSCGVDKCFWPSVSEPATGYLVTAESGYDGLREASLFAEQIEDTCGARQLFLKGHPAKLVNVTTDFMKQLAKLVHNPSRVAVGEESPWVFYKKDTRVTVQRVVRAPSTHLLYGTYGTKWDAMMKDIPSFLKKVKVPLPVLRKRLQEEKKKLQCVLEHAGRVYWHDTQGIIDTKGRYYHIDLDHHFNLKGSSQDLGEEEELERRKKCLNYFQEMIDVIMQEGQMISARKDKAQVK